MAMRLISDDEVAAVLTMRDAVAAMTAAFEQFGNGAGAGVAAGAAGASSPSAGVATVRARALMPSAAIDLKVMASPDCSRRAWLRARKVTAFAKAYRTIGKAHSATLVRF